MEFIPTQTIDEGDWRRSIMQPVMQNLLQPSSTTTAKELKDFIIVEGEYIVEEAGVSWLELHQKMRFI